MTNEYEKSALVEFEKSAAEIKRFKSASEALTKSFARFDHIIARATEASSIKPACKAGCAYCCYYKVEVRAHELFALHGFMQTHFSAEQTDNILSAARANAEIIRGLTPEEHLTTNLKCPLLVDNKCSVYAVRPYRCRNFHASDVTGCEQSFAEPTSLTVTSHLIESIAILGDAHSQGFEAAAERAGGDARVYDLTTGLLDVFVEKNALKRCKQGKRSFPNAIVVNDLL